MTAQAIFDVVNVYAAKVGVEKIAPRDFRCTAAKLAQKGQVRTEEARFVNLSSQMTIVLRQRHRALLARCRYAPE